VHPTFCPSRRTLLATAGAGLGALVLGGCGGDDVRSVSGSGSGTVLVALADLPVGTATELDVDGRRVLLTRPDETTVLGFDAECTHQGCNVRAGADGGLACPCHGSVFDPASGEPTEGPADAPLGTVAVAISDEDVVLA
jgi:Rieske Fe-S protein